MASNPSCSSPEPTEFRTIISPVHLDEQMVENDFYRELEEKGDHELKQEGVLRKVKREVDHEKSPGK